MERFRRNDTVVAFGELYGVVLRYYPVYGDYDIETYNGEVITHVPEADIDHDDLMPETKR